ncbi:MAG: polyphosphate kinase 1 [Balneolaceae bacterium]|nr:MAG: polyphosphate kinase 1 [Balneolaceae bacterium]
MSESTKKSGSGFEPINLLDIGEGKPKPNPLKNKVLKSKGLNKDPRSSDLKIFGKNYFDNYELSWLKFNWRVLAEALNPKNPLLERTKFIGIVCSNLDEFFQKRVGGLKRQVHAGVTELTVDGRTPEEQLAEIRHEVLKMIKAYRNCFLKEILPALEIEGIRITPYNDLSDELKVRADDYFEKQIYPIVTPLAVDQAHPFPFISNKSRSLAIKLRNPRSGEILFARIKIPTNRPRWIELEQSDEAVTLLSVKDLIVEKLMRFFPGMEVLSANIFRVTRNADIERNEEEADDLLEMIEDELRERKFAEVVRLEIDRNMPRDIRTSLLNNLNIQDQYVFEMEGPIGLADVTQLCKLGGFPHLKSDSWVPALHPVFRHPLDESAPNIFQVIKNGDFLVHHPYHSFETSTQRFIEEAANDPKVLAIKQTLYRTSSDSAVMHSLIKAAEDDKQVAVLVELKARFDEEQNITWAQKLEKAGVHVSYGIPGLKIHSKLTIVVREETAGLRRYVHIGTGNYHPDTAQLYEDLGLFTCDDELATDVTNVFNLLTGYAPEQTFQKTFVAPRHLRSNIVKLIDGEIQEALEGRKAQIIAKMNSLEDPLIIQKLYEASQAGVETDLIVRGVCRLIPQKPGLSEKIRVHSVIGRFLEHSRCYYFHKGGEDAWYIGSADWMHRNLDARVEVLAPIENPELKRYLGFMMRIYLHDNTQRWMMKPNGNYVKVKKKKSDKKLASQQFFMDHTKNLNEPIPRSFMKH